MFLFDLAFQKGRGWMTCTTRTEDVPVLNVSFLPCKINCGNHQVANLKIIMNNNDRKETVYFELFISDFGYSVKALCFSCSQIF
jgi:hypothetical protein